MNKKLKNVVILTQNARHFNLGGSIGPRGADILIPTPNKED